MENLDDLKEQRDFCLHQIEYLEGALAQYKTDLVKLNEEINAQTAAA